MARINSGDVSLHVEQQGSGPVLLLVHGFPLDHTMWRGQLDGLSDVCRIVAPDLRGFGRSDAAEGALTMERFADDLAALLDAMEITEPVTFCGLSMGGYVGWQFWRRHANRLQRMILCDTRAVADGPQAAQDRRDLADRIMSEGAATIADMMIPRLFSDNSREQQPDLVGGIRDVMLATRPATIAGVLRGMSEREDFSGVLGEIDVAALVICGRHDVISPAAEMREIAAAMPMAQFVEIPGAGHMAPLEDVDATNAAIREFLAGG